MFATKIPVSSLRPVTKRFYAAAATTGAIKKTALYDLHVKHGGKMVPFAGYSMPVQYGNMGLIASHLHTREKASIFDVSHMLQSRVTGKDRKKFFETLVVADLHNMPVGQGTLSVFTNEQGGIIDDTIIMQQEDNLYVVSNAACADKDIAHIRKHLTEFQNKGGDVDFNIITDHSLIAIQGPKAAAALEELVGKDLNDFGFMHGRHMDIAGVPCHVARSGYTGEDGFELSIPTEEIVTITEKLLAHPDVELAGLGARDSLRLEAGLCLYGNDLDETTTPVEAGLTWTIPKSRRETGGFLGAEHILPQIKGGVTRRRIGLIVEGAPARGGAEILNKEGEVIGTVTSGCPSPSLKKNIAMGYVKNGYHKKGTELNVKVRNKVYSANVTKMPFVEAKYHK
ncbi:aminomethyltransferase mitochondrial precursor [Rhizopus microsporus var. microsporus]|uniref:Aminomethyltransferase n=2 Tax=Rhizopus microsporus TaxID=58291 RepID=A0A2G4SGR8_RHIZD|nr:aminomethyltransferase mitochondrial precursor [Rhizopus microsporus ATCC 52813]ORE11028.1 aminomethyltransferase mitochondrial precursor [Rhizopus microsporus var. microsporus]PHZ07953.1 aminomethyltransferase mitochondrial precursor [Rhizopus microsporus ATCC 52813]